ncbi:hypothetical protein N780_12310 [Pontibacillus chungwhensis BH030062]|uniref:Uncharacterized protein n=1 Tax=Pontibacillus chungwhensis BH030062 TaxID=1385513 RepID=A0A0A2UZE2_9BACI|nr:DUF5345 family protein [Pontibacillus chungwhensis]KGP93294.1 hypothetical protein N780_12310 [Pontibacillus chungwhensis BH030062]
MKKHNENNMFEDKVTNDLKDFHESIDVEQPDFNHLLHLVQTEQNQRHQDIWKELMFLWGMSVIILALLAILYFYTPILFGLSQLGVITSLAVYFYKEKVKVMRYDPS